MQSFSTIFVLLLTLLPHVLSAPIPEWSSKVMNAPAVDDDASKARVAAYNEADARAKEMVTKMHTVVNSDKPEHQKIVNDAFGPNADRDKIKATIHKLNTQQVTVGTTDIAGVKAGIVASTPMTRPNGPSGHIKLGPEFFAADASKDYRAGTLIHEATHQQSHTGDLINTNNHIVHALADQKKDIKMQDDGKPHIGYHFPGPENPKKVPTSAAELSDKYKANRDSTVHNMHDNADSYRVFAHLCSAPGVARRDLELFRRALFEADEDDHLFLAKRNSCELPKDYFKKKAEAKAAAAKKTTGTESHSTSHGHTASTQPGHKTYAEALKTPAHGHGASAQPAHGHGASAQPAHGHGTSALATHGHSASAQTGHGHGASAQPAHGHGASAQPAHGHGAPAPAPHGHGASAQTGHKTYAEAVKSAPHGHAAPAAAGHASHPANAAAAPHPPAQQKKTGKK